MTEYEKLVDKFLQLTRNRSSREQLAQIWKEIVERITDKRRSPEYEGQKREIGEMLRPLPDLLGLSDNAFCEKAGISPSSFSRWKHGKEMPTSHRLNDLANLLQKDDRKQTFKHSVLLDDSRRVTLRPFNQLLDRQSRCKRVWSIKNKLPFRAGMPGNVQKGILDRLCDSHEASAVQYHFIFLGPEDMHSYSAGAESYSTFPAFDSFARLKQCFFSRTSDSDIQIRQRLQGYRVINSPEAYLKLGISNFPIGINFLEYDEKRTAGHPSLAYRVADLFFEQPHSVYRHALHELNVGDSHTCWSEVPPHISEWDWRAIEPELNRIANREQGALALPVLETQEELSQYKPKRFISNP